MEEALYGEGGYYSRPDLPIGEEGDYVTGSALSPLFGRVTARLLERLDEALGKASAELFEAGYGTGAHLESVVSALLERTLGRRIRAWDRIARPVPAGVERVRDLEEIGEGEIEGLIFSYELFDALPVHRLIGRADGTVGELWVDLDEEGGFAWREGDAVGSGACWTCCGIRTSPSSPARSRISRRHGSRSTATWPGGWAAGLLVTCDYGFERERLLDPRIRLQRHPRLLHAASGSTATRS